MSEIIHLKTVNQALKAMGLGKPKHPLISVFRHCHEIKTKYGDTRFTGNLFMISMKDGISGSFNYGRNAYDFEEGMMTFIAPNQVISPGDSDADSDSEGWSVLFHPDLIRQSPLGKTIKNYSFFDYEVNEALFLSDKEKESLTELVSKIEEEIEQNMDQHTQQLIVSNLELLLKYCTRYYDRQFYTRSNLNKDVLSRFQHLMKKYFKEEKQLDSGIPSVQYCAKELNMSPGYLSDLLKKETGRTAQDHIHSYIIDKAKTILLQSNDTVSRIAFGLGFGYSQHFSRLFKNRTGLTPKEYRNLN